MQPWKLAVLGQREFPRDLTTLEIVFYFSFSAAEIKAIRTRRRELNQPGAALHLGFIKMIGRSLGSAHIVPRPLLVHVGKVLYIDVPTPTSVRALYRRRSTLFEHQQRATKTLGFCSLTEQQHETTFNRTGEDRV